MPSAQSLAVRIPAFSRTKTASTDAVGLQSSLSANIGVLITLVRQTWSFVKNFGDLHNFESAGLKGSTVVVVLVVIVCCCYHFRGSCAAGDTIAVKGI